MIKSVLVPFIIILLPILGYILFLSRIRVRSLAKVLLSGLLACLAAAILPFIAMFISANGMAASIPDDGVKCVTGAITFLGLGYLINFIGIPIAGIYYYLSRE